MVPVNQSMEESDKSRHLLRRYLEEAPLAVALFRACEAVAFSTVALERPILDVGCGFGEFGRIFFEDALPPEAGIDLDRAELKRERQLPACRSVAQCDARKLPFKDASFGSVMSVSTLEHIPEVSAVFPEVARVLRPGGVFAFSVPIDTLNANLLGHRLLSVGSAKLADRYARLVHRSLTHVNVWPAATWTQIVASAGMAVERAEPILSPPATKWFEALLPAAYGSRLWRRVTGRRPPHPGMFVRMAERRMLPLVRQGSAAGSNLFVVARKPS